MSEGNPYYPAPDPDDAASGSRRRDDGSKSEQIQHRSVSARVPEAVARGVFSTGAIIITGQTEFVIDFALRMGRPYHVVARIVMPHSVMPRFIAALEENVKRYEEKFGLPPVMPKPENPRRPSIQEIYDDLKLSDDVLSGAYANNVMIGHSPAEFSFDFITNFFPTSAVSRRVFISAPQVIPLLDSLRNTYKQLQAKLNPPPPPFDDDEFQDDTINPV